MFGAFWVKTHFKFQIDAYYFRKSSISPIAFRAKIQNIFPLGYWKNVLFIYFVFILTTTYNLNESGPSIVMLLYTVFNGTLFFIGDSEH